MTGMHTVESPDGHYRVFEMGKAGEVGVDDQRENGLIRAAKLSYSGGGVVKKNGHCKATVFYRMEGESLTYDHQVLTIHFLTIDHNAHVVSAGGQLAYIEAKGVSAL